MDNEINGSKNRGKGNDSVWFGLVLILLGALFLLQRTGMVSLHNWWAIFILIPGINIAAPCIWGLFSAWMLAVEYIDYPMANHLLHFSKQRQLLRQRRMLSYGFGGSSLLMTMIPFVNFLAMPVSVAGATAMWVGELRQHVQENTA